MKSKYIGKVFDGYEVKFGFKRNPYRLQYGKDKAPMQHPAYSFLLINEDASYFMILSGNQMRLLEQGKRTVMDMLTNNRGNKNPYINFIRQSERKRQKRRVKEIE